MQIHKCKLTPGENRDIQCVDILSVIEQDGEVTLYYLNDHVRNKLHTICTVGTGWNLDVSFLDCNFLGTVKCGIYVWHVFYRKT